MCIIMGYYTNIIKNGVDAMTYKKKYENLMYHIKRHLSAVNHLNNRYGLNTWTVSGNTLNDILYSHKKRLKGG